jgi:hypothetical protein
MKAFDLFSNAVIDLPDEENESGPESVRKFRASSVMSEHDQLTKADREYEHEHGDLFSFKEVIYTLYEEVPYAKIAYEELYQQFYQLDSFPRRAPAALRPGDQPWKRK